VWPMQRDRGQCFIQVEAAVVDRMRGMRRHGESYRDVILRLVELEAGRNLLKPCRLTAPGRPLGGLAAAGGRTHPC
jgi:hypothetical protein